MIRNEKLNELTTKVNAIRLSYDLLIKYLNQSIKLQKLTCSILSLEKILKSNGPFQPEIENIIETSIEDEFIYSIVNSIPENIPMKGVLNHGQLTERFEILKQESLIASYIKPSNNLFTFMLSKFISFLIFEEKGNYLF
jgi:hypothetical protein